MKATFSWWLVEEVEHADKCQLVYRFLVDAQPEQVPALIQSGVIVGGPSRLNHAHHLPGGNWMGKPRFLPASTVDTMKDPEEWESAEVAVQGKTARKQHTPAVKVSRVKRKFINLSSADCSVLQWAVPNPPDSATVAP